MAKVRVLYWKEIPVQVQATDGSDQVSQPLDARFQEGVDAIAMADGSSGSEDYLMAWEWGEYAQMTGSARDVADQLAARFNAGFPLNFVAKVKELHIAGNRDPRAGAVDRWCGQ